MLEDPRFHPCPNPTPPTSRPQGCLPDPRGVSPAKGVSGRGRRRGRGVEGRQDGVRTGDTGATPAPTMCPRRGDALPSTSEGAASGLFPASRLPGPARPDLSQPPTVGSSETPGPRRPRTRLNGRKVYHDKNTSRNKTSSSFRTPPPSSLRVDKYLREPRHRGWLSPVSRFDERSLGGTRRPLAPHPVVGPCLPGIGSGPWVGVQPTGDPDLKSDRQGTGIWVAGRTPDGSGNRGTVILDAGPGGQVGCRTSTTGDLSTGRNENRRGRGRVLLGPSG